MPRLHVFFFRGLSTYHDDNAKWGPLDFGPIHGPLEKALKARGIEFHPILGMGSGSLEEVATRACEALKAHPVWRDPATPVYFLSHSAGGLVARLVLHSLQKSHGREELSRKVRAHLSVATPHHGSRLADIVSQMPERQKRSARVFRLFGYDLRKRKHFFAQLAPENVELIMKDVESASIPQASIICSLPRRDWSWPLRACHLIKAVREFDQPSDGLIERESQMFGQVVGQIAIDHFRQVGLFGGRRQFNLLCDAIQSYFVVKTEPGREPTHANASATDPFAKP